ncbi:MAG TPA: SRPBCC family protein [Burkholderiaceae bacterium]|nr:SRPBCC family protein [Burkholderiaceae bacterium]
MQLQRVVRSTIIDAPIERVWAVLRDFNSHVDWHPAVAESRIERDEPPDQVGCVRNFRLADGNTIREQLLALSDREHVSTYCILDSTVPLQRYVATVRLKPVTDGRRTFWHWQSTFGTPPGRERELTQMVATQVYEAGFAALRKYLSDGRDAEAARHLSAGAAAASIAPPAAPARAGAALPGTCIVLSARGGAEQLQPAATAAPAPGAGEVRIRQTAIGVNYIDVYARTGLYAALLEVGGVPGVEAAGTVIDVGPEVTHLLPGDRVAYACLPTGSYASVRTLPAEPVLRLQPWVSDQQAAAVMLKGMTAEYCLFRLHRLERGETVLVHAAAGGLGMLVAQWARALGATVIGTVGSAEKARTAREYCEHVITTHDEGGPRFADAVLQATAGRGVDLIIDGLGEPAREENMRALALLGHWISVGQAAGAWNPIDPAWLAQKSATFSRPVVFHYTAQPRRLREMATRVFDALRDGILRPQISTWALSAAAEAHRELQSRRTVGQLVLIG